MVCDYHNPNRRYKGKIVNLYQIDNLRRDPCETACCGDIVCVSGIADLTIGDTLCDPASVEPIEFQAISQPTIEMTFCVNNSPFAGRDGKFVTSRQIRERLQRELLKDVSLRVSDTDTTTAFWWRAVGKCISPF